jgi:hypothetical protein
MLLITVSAQSSLRLQREISLKCFDKFDDVPYLLLGEGIFVVGRHNGRVASMDLSIGVDDGIIQILVGGDYCITVGKLDLGAVQVEPGGAC